MPLLLPQAKEGLLQAIEVQAETTTGTTTTTGTATETAIGAVAKVVKALQIAEQNQVLSGARRTVKTEANPLPLLMVYPRQNRLAPKTTTATEIATTTTTTTTETITETTTEIRTTDLTAATTETKDHLLLPSLAPAMAFPRQHL